MHNKPLLVLLLMSFLLAGSCYAQEEVTVEEPGRAPVLSALHMWRGEQALQSGNSEEATEEFLQASGYMRSSPYPHFALARVYLRSSVMDAFLEFATGVKLLLTDFVHQSLLVSNLAMVLFISIGLTVYTGAAIVISKHARTVWHSVIITLSPWIRGWYLKAAVIGSVLSFFVILSGRSPIGMATWALVLGAGLCWKFAVTSERKVLVGLIVFLIAFGFAFDLCTRVLSTQQPDSPVRLAAMVDRVNEERLMEGIENSRVSPDFDPISGFMRGLLALEKGDYNTAVGEFNLASKFEPHNPAILNNLGVAYHRLGRYEEAKAKFREGLRYGPREALIHYNYAQTLNALLQYDLSQQELAKASTLDFDLTRSLVTQKESSNLVPMNLQTRILWKLAFEPDNRTIDLSYHPVESGTAGIIILAFLAGGLMVAMKKAKIPARCDICGKTVQSQITRRRRKEFVCPECHAIKERAATSDTVEEDLDNRLRRKVMLEAVKRIVLGLLVPGSAHYLSGRRSQGLALAFVIFALLILVISHDAVVKPIPNLGTSYSTGWSLPLFIVIYALYCWRSTLTAIRSVQEA